jgi:hypothetical protein
VGQRWAVAGLCAAVLAWDPAQRALNPLVCIVLVTTLASDPI